MLAEHGGQVGASKRVAVGVKILVARKNAGRTRVPAADLLCQFCGQWPSLPTPIKNVVVLVGKIGRVPIGISLPVKARAPAVHEIIRRMRMHMASRFHTACFEKLAEAGFLPLRPAPSDADRRIETCWMFDSARDPASSPVRASRLAAIIPVHGLVMAS